jgi:hypothetical protein
MKRAELLFGLGKKWYKEGNLAMAKAAFILSAGIFQDLGEYYNWSKRIAEDWANSCG